MTENRMGNLSKVCALILLGAVVIISLYSFIHVGRSQKNSEIKYLDTGWVDADGQEAHLDTFDDTENTVSRYITINSDAENKILFFSARNMYVDVYMNDQLMMEDDKEQFFMFGKSPGTRWHMVSLPISDVPITIELRGIASFSNAAGHIDNICIGDPDDIDHNIVLKNIVSFIMNVIWQLLGVALLIGYIVLRKKHKFGKDFLYLALGVYFCAQWCITETQILQFLIGFSAAIHLIEYLSLFAIPIPFGLLAAEQLSKKWVGQLYSLLAEINLLVAFALHMTGIREFHYTTWTVYIFLVLLVPLGYRVIKGYAQNEDIKQTSSYIVASFSCTVIFIGIGIIRYLSGHYEDYALYIRISLFFFLLVLVIYQLAGLNAVIKKGMESELLHELALTDHLTKFYNRSGFAEHQIEYEKAVSDNEHFGIIQFDVNNLKLVNDNQGHEKGDELLCLASSGIYQSYGMTGKCYRMGGDEFLVILRGEDPENDYKVGIKNLEMYCCYANSVEDRTFDLKIAHGFTMVKEGDTLQGAMDRADDLMYANKKKMKEQAKVLN